MRYSAGERVKTSGIYRSIHLFHPEHNGENALHAGACFPRCTLCPNVDYVLLRASPNPEEDRKSLSKKTGSSN